MQGKPKGKGFVFSFGLYKGNAFKSGIHRAGKALLSRALAETAERIPSDISPSVSNANHLRDSLRQQSSV